MIRGLLEAAREFQRNYTLDWMHRNLPPEEITLANYIALDWCNEKTFKALEGEEL